jgi:hypothetical protein
MTTPDPVPPSSPTRISMETTAGTVRAAMSATDPIGRSLLCTVWVIDGSGSVRSAAPSAVSRPTSPPAAPTSSATSPRAARARGCTRRPNSSSRTLSRAPSPRTGSGPAGSAVGGGPSATAASGFRQGSRSAAASQNAGSPDSSAGWPGGRCRAGAAPSGRPNALARAVGGGDLADTAVPSGVASRVLPEPEAAVGAKPPATPFGRPKVAATPGSTAGRSSGRGPSRGGLSWCPLRP